MVPLYPLTFRPILKERVWGGNRLEELYRKPVPPGAVVGESWEIADRPNDVSIIRNGEFAGKDLHFLTETRAKDLLGDIPTQNGRFPLLIKILDAADKLSVQVHPPAEKAASLRGEPKTEFWYVAEAAPGAELYAGLRHGGSREQFVRNIQSGTVERDLHRIKVRQGDALFLPSGRVHALGAGLVIFEVQQNSDTTYRVYDWNRPGADGKPRELHLNESLESIDFEDFEPQLLKATAKTGELPVWSLLRHDLFSIELASIAKGKELALQKGAMQILGMVTGQGQVKSREGSVDLICGGFALVPAASNSATVRAQTDMVLLVVGPGCKG